MNWVHIHLLINHVPLTGLLFSVMALLWAQWRASPEVQRFGLGAMALTGLLSFISWSTGDLAASMEAGASPPDLALVSAHAEAARVAMIATTALGTGALWALLYPKEPAAASAKIIWALLVGALICIGLMAWTGAEGGAIRHGALLGPWALGLGPWGPGGGSCLHCLGPSSSMDIPGAKRAESPLTDTRPKAQGPRPQAQEKPRAHDAA